MRQAHLTAVGIKLKLPNDGPGGKVTFTDVSLPAEDLQTLMDLRGAVAVDVGGDECLLAVNNLTLDMDGGGWQLAGALLRRPDAATVLICNQYAAANVAAKPEEIEAIPLTVMPWQLRAEDALD